MEKIGWGIIGCGDVTELKSGPAFNKVINSSLVAVMRRDLDKARQYAEKHNVPAYYNDANELINDPHVNAIYIATPPSSHEHYALAAIGAGKQVYLEKPMALDFDAASRIVNAADQKKVKLTVAHYRREQPIFKKIKQLLESNAIGEILLVSLQYYKKVLTPVELNIPRIAWRVDPIVSGGGLFHDLAPHQLDLLYYFFGDALSASGLAINQSGSYPADDMVIGNILFRSGIAFNGIWFFNSREEDEKDSFEIIGTNGKISFSVFQHEKFFINIHDTFNTYTFDKIEHVQQPMIEKVVDFFLGKGSNPCSGNEGAIVMKMINAFTLHGKNKIYL